MSDAFAGKYASGGADCYKKALEACEDRFIDGRPRHQSGASSLIHKMTYSSYMDAVRSGGLLALLREEGALKKNVLLTGVPFQQQNGFAGAVDALGRVTGKDYTFHGALEASMAYFYG